MTTSATSAPPQFAVGSLVRARGREWVVLPGSTAGNNDDQVLLVRPLGGGPDDTAALLTALETIEPATFSPPTVDDLGDASSAGLLRTALRIGFRSSAGPFRSLASLAVEPRAYQYVPLMMALRQRVTRLLIADDVGIGKTVESALIAAELLAQGEVTRTAVLCSPALAEQWQDELRTKFGIDAELVLTSTVKRLERGLMLDESLFDRYPHLVVSTDFIKSPTRRHEFVNHAPELIIVDEAHTAVAGADGTTQARHQRYELLTKLAADPDRHLLLVTATPHSGKDEGFRNLLGLLDPTLAQVDLTSDTGRSKLAGHMVQRRRSDIRRFLDQETAFPSDRESKEVPYLLGTAYARLFEKVLAYAREQVTDGGPTTAPGSADGQHPVSPLRQRVRWWSALALLRSLASSPDAAAATLRTRAAGAACEDVEEVDRIGRAQVLDAADDEAVDSDMAPGALDDVSDRHGPDAAEGDENREFDAGAGSQRKRLLAMAREAEALRGPKQDRKLHELIQQVKALLADGFDPIVFCRFIPTAEYVAEHLGVALGTAVDVAAVTGALPPVERRTRIAELTQTDKRHVLVATDCLSEGVNLQDAFQAVVHYDLAWNPTRHEQREGRVDRFGQRHPHVRAVTLYGTDNRIDGVVLDVLIRKHQAIKAATGVSVPVPEGSASVVEALMEGLLLRGRDDEQLALDVGMDRRTTDLHREWSSAAEVEKESVHRFAQRGIHPEEVAEQVNQARAALGGHAEVEAFVDSALRGLGASVRSQADGLVADTSALPLGLRDALPAGHAHPLPFHRDLPVPRKHALLARTDPAVETLARYLVDSSLDAAGAETASNGSELVRPARRGGVVRTRAVRRRTTALLLRLRFHLDLPEPARVGDLASREGRGPGRARPALRNLVAEDAVLVAFEGSPAEATWLPEDAAHALMAAAPDANIPADQARSIAARVIDQLPALTPHLEQVATDRAAALLANHRSVRADAGAWRQGLRVRASLPVDVLGVYVYLPVAAESPGGAPAGVAS